ncbi:right-handed parallel beta-helix repeat-containing protein [Neolewinella persica]|uniref:right-handed parallel beta-helix repeat-containing protein n=1 Tax=Neolewinella persica TaxID=70998 RepID=UPI00146F471F|nr:right-handed parallel beta-helix repeat-containing protein [Neolewinella persica]
MNNLRVLIGDFNDWTFSDVIPAAAGLQAIIDRGGLYNLCPQDSPIEEQFVELTEGEDFLLRLGVDTSSGNRYEWTKDSVTWNTYFDNDTFNLPQVTFEDAGVYEVIIYNDAVPGMCMRIAPITVEVILVDCPGGSTTFVTSNSDSGPGSLREAINCANEDTLLDTIIISVQGTLSVTSALPPITDDNITIIGSDEEGSSFTITGALLSGEEDGIQIIGADDVYLQNLRIERFGNSGILVENSQRVSLTGNTVTLNGFTNNSGDGIFLKSGSNSARITNNILSFNAEDGLDINDGSSFIIEGNISFNNGRSGICLYNTTDGTVEQNTLGNQSMSSMVQTTGLLIDSFCTQLTIRRNHIGTNDLGEDQGNSMNGIRLRGSSNQLEISENDIAFNQSRGISMAATISRCYMSSNSFYCQPDEIIRLATGANGGILPPIIASSSTTTQVEGTVTAGATAIELYAVDHSRCGDGGLPCQGTNLLGTSAVQAGETAWNFSVAPELPAGTQVIVLAHMGDATSAFSNCVQVEPPCAEARAMSPTTLRQCENTSTTINLRGKDSEVIGSLSGYSVVWLRDTINDVSINNPETYDFSEGVEVYARVVSDICTSQAVVLLVQISPLPTLSCIYNDNRRELDISYSGTPPLRLGINRDGVSITTITNMAGNQSLGGTNVNEFIISLEDGNGCTVMCNFVVPRCDDLIQNGNETGIDCGGSSCSPCAGDDECDHPDYAALMALYRSTRGLGWNFNGTNDIPSSTSAGWGKDCLPCEWYGITCDSTERVTRLDLDGVADGNFSSMPADGNNLVGLIPDSIGLLSELVFLNLSYNLELRGSEIPQGIGDLGQLTRLYLINNNLTGSLPPSLGQLSRIETISIVNNSLLDGPLPVTLGNLTRLQILNLSNNNLTDTIPISFGSLRALSYLNLNGNQIEGKIPRQLGELPLLSILFMSDNKLNGEIPETLANLPIGELSMHTNNLSGCIPESFQNRCGENIRMYNNPLLPYEGNFVAWCNSGGISVGANCDDGAITAEMDRINDDCTCGCFRNSLPVEASSANICNQDSILFGEEFVYEAGIYSDTLQALEGCDSLIRQLTLFNEDRPVRVINAVVCTGSSYLFNGELLTPPDSSEWIRPAPFGGCDSLIILHLSATEEGVFLVVDDEKSLLRTDEEVLIDVLVNDLFDGPVEIEVDQPSSGEVVVIGNEIFYYPDGRTIGDYVFTYRLCPTACNGPCLEGRVILQITADCFLELQENSVNVFTPNGDGHNDFFDPKERLSVDCRNDIEFSEIRIYNSSGHLIFKSSTFSRWDGRRGNGNLVSSGTYQYRVTTSNGKVLTGAIEVSR